MVIILFLLTVAVFLVVDLVLRKEERMAKRTGTSKRTPIFLSPEKALIPIGNNKERKYHVSHSWALQSEPGSVYVGFDNFIPALFASDVIVDDVPQIGSHVDQGDKAWSVKMNGKTINQLIPVSGTVIDINPAIAMHKAFSSDKIGQSWILKMNAPELESESHNLMNYNQAQMMNSTLVDDFFLNNQMGQYLNDGGRLTPDYISKIPEEQWDKIVQRYFPYKENISEK